MTRLWVFSELYYPEDTSTGYFVTGIAEGLAANFEVRVVCGRPTYSERHLAAAPYEERFGTHIRRIWASRFDKDRLLGRFLNLITFTLSATLYAATKLRRGDRLLVLTNPPSLPPLIGLVARLKGARPALLTHDVYPEVLAASGFLQPRSLIYRLADRFMAATLRLFDPIVVLGRDMAEVTAAKLGGDQRRIEIIPNWGDVDAIRPIPRATNPFALDHGLTSKTVIQLSGNLGRTHDIGLVLELAASLAEREDILFAFVGQGGKTRLISEHLASRRAGNVLLLPRQPREKLGQMLAAADAVIIPFIPRMRGVSVPSRMYNVLAAGVPIIAVAEADSELAMVVSEERAGWVVAPGDLEGLRSVVLSIAADRSEARARGAGGRRAAEARYGLAAVLDRFRQALCAPQSGE